MATQIQIDVPDQQVDGRYSHAFDTNRPLPREVVYIANTSTTGSVVWAILLIFCAVLVGLLLVPAVLTILKGGKVATQAVMLVIGAVAIFGAYRLCRAGLRHLQARRDLQAGAYRDGFYLFGDALLAHIGGKNTLIPKPAVRRIEKESVTGSDHDGRVRSRLVTHLFYQDEQAREQRLTFDGSFGITGSAFFAAVQAWHTSES